MLSYSPLCRFACGNVEKVGYDAGFWSGMRRERWDRPLQGRPFVLKINPGMQREKFASAYGNE
jgi:hypothetical protein